MEFRAMRIKMLIECGFRLSLVFLLVTACTSRFDTARITGLPASVSRPGAPDVDVDIVLASAQHEVQQVLPDAYLNSFTFSGKCKDLSNLHGRINLGFVQVRSSILRRQVLSGLVSVDTIEETMDLRFEDHSAYYPSTVLLTLQDGLTVKEVTAIAHEYITSLEPSDCDVTLTHLEDSWLVVCTELGSGTLGQRKCEFEIDASTGQIIATQE
jgi:hypothetical protein